MTFRFVHAADLHLDTPFEGIGRLSPDVQRALQEASLDAFDNLIDLCITEKVAFLLLAGDIYDGADHGVRAQLRVLQGLKRLADHGIRTFMIHGNHDPLDCWSAIRSWPPEVTIFSSDTVQSIPVEIDGRSVATIHGISYPQRAVTENLALRFKRSESLGLHIGLLHCTVGSDSGHDAYSPCTINDLLDARMDYWALGHIHKRQYLKTGDPWVVYPGNLQGRSPKPSELDAKGACLVTVDDQSVVTDVRFVPLDQIRFLTFEFDVTGIQDIGELRAALADQAERSRAEHDSRGLLLRARLTGRGVVSADLARDGAIDGLLQGLRGEMEGLEPFRFWCKLVNDSRPEIDRDALLAAQRFSSEVLRVIDELPGASEMRARFDGGLRIPPFVQASKISLELVEFGDLVKEAERLVLDLLERGERS